MFSSCEKRQTEEERNAEIDRRVQQQLAAERQTQEKEQLSQQEADIAAREKELAAKQSADTSAVESRQSNSERETTRSTRTEERAPRDYDRDRRPTGSYDTFYTKLDTYGDWRETSDYGYVFQPRQAQSRNWRPYTDGRWVYTDVGWTWISEEPFGWATYHYGRWTRLRNIGWVWVPGDEWAPAWVSWRKSDDYVGWAPLPPEARFDRRSGIHNWADNYYDIGPDQYCFVETRQFGAPRAQRDVLPSERNVIIINQTTNITNITYSNTTVINNGPNYDELRKRSVQPIERFKLDRQVNIDVNVQVPRSEVRGQLVVISAPFIARGPATERPRRVKENISQVTVEHGWSNVGDQQAADKVRAKMKSEAPPPSDAPPKGFVKPAATAPLTVTGPSTPAPVSSVAPAAMATSPPTASQFRGKYPLATPAAAPPKFTPRPAVNSAAKPAPSAGTAAAIAPVITPVPSGGSTNSLSTSVSPAFGRAGKGRELRKQEKQLRRQERKTGETSPADSAPPRPIVSATPLPSASFSAPPTTPSPSAPEFRESRKEKRQMRKEEKRNRKRGIEQAPDEAQPSPTPTPVG